MEREKVYSWCRAQHQGRPRASRPGCQATHLHGEVAPPGQVIFLISICKSVSFSLSPPFSLCHILMHQTAFIYLHLRKLDQAAECGAFSQGCLYTVAGRGNLHIALVDWQTDLYNCTLILSQVVGFTIFPHSHVHSPTRVLHRSTPLSVAETQLVAVPCCRLIFMPYIFRHCDLLILKVISI